MKVERSGRMTSKLKAFTARVERRVDRGLMAAGRELLAQSQPLVPVDTQTLKDDGHVRGEGFGFATQIIVGYGTYGVVKMEYSPKENKIVTRIPAEYAVYAHEDYRQPGAGYLEAPLLTKQNEIRTAFNVGAGIR